MIFGFKLKTRAKQTSLIFNLGKQQWTLRSVFPFYFFLQRMSLEINILGKSLCFSSQKFLNADWHKIAYTIFLPETDTIPMSHLGKIMFVRLSSLILSKLFSTNYFLLTEIPYSGITQFVFSQKNGLKLFPFFFNLWKKMFSTFYFSDKKILSYLHSSKQRVNFGGAVSN